MCGLCVADASSSGARFAKTQVAGFEHDMVIVMSKCVRLGGEQQEWTGIRPCPKNLPARLITDFLVADLTFLELLAAVIIVFCVGRILF